jgi:outer membrane protein OmpA-like peptidoglycan-associated protein
MTKTLVRLAAVMVFALSTSACSTIDDMLGEDTPAATPTTDSNGFPTDAPPQATASDSGSAVAPDLASVPDKPVATSTPDDQRQAADSLAADRTRAKYSSDALRGGTEAAAAPPPPPGAAPAPDMSVAANTPQPDNTPSASDTAPTPSTAGAPPPQDNSAPAPAPTTPVAAMGPPPGSQPAVPATAGISGTQPMAMADGPLGFKPSTAPPLDPSISQVVAQPIIARYQETAANGGVATGPIAPLNGGAVAMATPRTRSRGRAMGGPEAMSGAVVANLDAINNPATVTPSVYANASGLPPAAVVMFPGDGTALDSAGRAQVRAAVTAFQQRGGAGYIKVVGHSSSRTSNMPVEKHLVAIFAKSQARANAVAKEIIREGVPASRVLVEAVGDSQPVYYESMPQGEAGNRRAEIFIQG